MLPMDSTKPGHGTTVQGPTVCGHADAWPWTSSQRPLSLPADDEGSLPKAPAWLGSRGAGGCAAWNSGVGSVWEQRTPSPVTAGMPLDLMRQEERRIGPPSARGESDLDGSPEFKLAVTPREGGSASLPSAPGVGAAQSGRDMAPMLRRRSLSADGGGSTATCPSSPGCDGRRTIPTPVRNLFVGGGGRAAQASGSSHGGASPRELQAQAEEAGADAGGSSPTLPTGTWSAGAFAVPNPAGLFGATRHEHTMPVPQLVIRSLANEMCERLFGTLAISTCGCAERERQMVVPPPPASDDGDRNPPIPPAYAANKETRPRCRVEARQGQEATEAQSAAAPRTVSVSWIGGPPRAARKSVGEITIQPDRALSTTSIGLSDEVRLVDSIGVFSERLEVGGDSGLSSLSEVDEPPETVRCGPQQPLLLRQASVELNMQPALPTPSRPSADGLDDSPHQALNWGHEFAADVQALRCSGSAALQAPCDHSAAAQEPLRTGMGSATAVSAGRAFTAARPCCREASIQSGPTDPSSSACGAEEVLDVSDWAARAVERAMRQPHLVPLRRRADGPRDASPTEETRPRPKALMTMGASRPPSARTTSRGLSRRGKVQTGAGFGEAARPGPRRCVFFPPPPVHANARLYHRGHYAEWTPRGEVAAAEGTAPSQPTNRADQPNTVAGV